MCGAYFAYTRCYIDQCVNFKIYLERQLKPEKDDNAFVSYIGVPFIFIIFLSLPFVMMFIFTHFLLILYMNIYTLFYYESVSELMLMQYGTSTLKSVTYAVAEPDAKYKLSWHLDAIDFDKKDEERTPYTLEKHYDGTKTIYTPVLGYTYKIEGKKNKYGYFIQEGDYSRRKEFEFTRSELESAGCKVVSQKFTCEDIRIR